MAKKFYKVTFPNEAVEPSGWWVATPKQPKGWDPYKEGQKEDLRTQREFGITSKKGKKNTSFVGTKKGLKGYFGSYGSELYPSDYKPLKTKK